MNDELLNKLYQKYPNFYKYQIVRDRNVRGVECGDGWFNIVNAFSAKCEELITSGKTPDLGLFWIKEKFGTMRIAFERSIKYDQEIEDLLHKFIEDSERLSMITCESCGVEGAKMRSTGWRAVLCDNCNTTEDTDEAT